MGLESFYVVRFDLGPLLQGQTRIPKLKSAYSLLINYNCLGMGELPAPPAPHFVFLITL